MYFVQQAVTEGSGGYIPSGDRIATFDNDGILPLFIGEVGAIETITLQGNHKVLISGGNEGGSPGPGTLGIVVRLWI